LAMKMDSSRNLRLLKATAICKSSPSSWQELNTN
jgi:hypothetical protein